MYTYINTIGSNRRKRQFDEFMMQAIYSTDVYRYIFFFSRTVLGGIVARRAVLGAEEVGNVGNLRGQVGWRGRRDRRVKRSTVCNTYI